MQVFSRFRALIFVAALLPLSGCLFRSERNVTTRLSTATLQEASLEQLVETINNSAAKLQTVNASVTIDASSGGEKKGKVTDYRQINGNVLVRKPGMMRMIGRVPVVGNHLFDMVTDGKNFELSVPPQNKFFVGSNQVTKPSEKPLENMRPQHIMDALLLKPIDAAAGEIAVLEHGTEIVKDPKTHKDAIQPDYVVVVISKDEKGYYLSRRVVFGRDDLQPHEQFIYNRQGQLATFAHYENIQDFGGTVFPTVVDIQRPVEEYAITLTILKLRLNEPLRDDQFQLTRPPGSQLINLDSSRAASAGNQPNPKDDPGKRAE